MKDYLTSLLVRVGLTTIFSGVIVLLCRLIGVRGAEFTMLMVAVALLIFFSGYAFTVEWFTWERPPRRRSTSMKRR